MELRAKLDDRPDRLWEEYPALLEFLRSQNVRDNDVFVYHWSHLALYSDLQLTPPHRFVLADSHEMFFPSQASRIRAAFEQAPYRYVVSDLGALGFNNEDCSELEQKYGMPMQLPTSVTERYPFTLPIMFRSGTLCVHERPSQSGPLSRNSS